MTDIKRGDVLSLGSHRLMCGDAFSAEDVAALMQGEKPDMLYCDPPYGMNVETTRKTAAAERSWRHGSIVAQRHDFPAVHGDSGPFVPAPLFHRFEQCKEQFWWGADYYRSTLPDGGSWIVWDKRPTGTLDKAFGSVFELCWSRKPHKRDIARLTWCGLAGQHGIDQRRLHPTQKPVKLAEWFLERYSKDGALIVDLFAGSGSTLLAAERLGRRAFVMEISPDYCQVILDRYMALTKQPRLLESA